MMRKRAEEEQDYVLEDIRRVLHVVTESQTKLSNFILQFQGKEDISSFDRGAISMANHQIAVLTQKKEEYTSLLTKLTGTDTNLSALLEAVINDDSNHVPGDISPDVLQSIMNDIDKFEDTLTSDEEDEEEL